MSALLLFFRSALCLPRSGWPQTEDMTVLAFGHHISRPRPITQGCAGSDEKKEAAVKASEDAPCAAAPGMKILSAEAHFHPFQVGAPRPEKEHQAIDEFCAKFAAGLAAPADDALLNLFADAGTWADPVGGPPPYSGKEALAERITKLPPMDFAKVAEVYYTVNNKIFLCKTEVKFADKPNSFFILDKFVVDDDFKILSAEAHFHPFQVGAPRPEEEHKAIDAFCAKFAAGLAAPADDALLNLFADAGTWEDPVGGPPPYSGKEALAERITKLPPMDFAKVAEVFYTVNNKIFLCKTEVKFADKPNSFFILDKFVVEY